MWNAWNSLRHLFLERLRYTANHPTWSIVSKVIRCVNKPRNTSIAHGLQLVCRHIGLVLTGTQVCSIPTKNIPIINLPINKKSVCVNHFLFFNRGAWNTGNCAQEKTVLQIWRNIREYKTNVLEAVCRY